MTALAGIAVLECPFLAVCTVVLTFRGVGVLAVVFSTIYRLVWILWITRAMVKHLKGKHMDRMDNRTYLLLVIENAGLIGKYVP